MTGRGRRLVVATALAGVLLVGLYVALGGGRFEPARSADPCSPRAWRAPSGLQAVVEQVVLSGLDGVACELGMTREALALTIADQGELEALARRKGIDDARLEEILRAGLQRAVVDGERAGALQPALALVLSGAIDRLDIGPLIGLYRSGRLDWLGAFVP